MSSNDPIGNLYKLCNVLAGTTKESGAARKRCAEIEERIRLCKEYGVPCEPGDIGDKMAHYASRDNFNDFIREMVSVAAQTLGNKTYSGTITRGAQGNWKTTSLFDFLYQLTRNEALNAEFHQLFRGSTRDEDKQDRFLEQHVKMNNYGEREAIKALLNEGKVNPLAESMSKIIPTFEEKYQFAC
ncbi:hypothetical protein BE21_36185 [Sorangium cellulosum]|uniref:Uncharacterized protein n=1 Tax=Sorangium cellulosum TaxID=56 RepID=A0A150TNF1_SORCE|nr:hypothetical protein BE21_36185 [Sorangium cellulosum]